MQTLGRVLNETVESNTGGTLEPEENSARIRSDAFTHNGEEASVDCFIFGSQESATDRAKRELLAELSSFRAEPYNPGTRTKTAWLSCQRENFPSVISLAKHILGIPATQIDNERIFSCAGKIATPPRSSIATNQIDNLVCIAKNHPENYFTSTMQDGVEAPEEFSDFIVSKEKPNDDNGELGPDEDVS